MPESDKDSTGKPELVFAYSRDKDGIYTGTAELVESSGQSMRPPFQTVVGRPDWVRFVVENIRKYPEAQRVAIRMSGPDNKVHQHYLDQRTVEKIKDPTLPVDDLIL